MGTTLIGLIVIAVVVVYIVFIYNRLVSLRNQFKNGFAQIDVQLQRRHDLIPNLVESAKAYLSHERNTLTEVMEARNNAVSSKALANFYAVAENYPELKANETIQQLMEELSSTENRVSFARQAYNDGVMGYNIFREQFPNNIVAGLFAFKPSSQLELESPEARQAPKVAF